MPLQIWFWDESGLRLRVISIPVASVCLVIPLPKNYATRESLSGLDWIIPSLCRMTFKKWYKKLGLWSFYLGEKVRKISFLIIPRLKAY